MVNLLRVEGKGNLFEIRRLEREVERQCGESECLGSSCNRMSLRISLTLLGPRFPSSVK